MTHLTFAHSLWREHLSPTDTAVDATCGNGQDTLVLARLLFQGTLFALDIQATAIENTRLLLAKEPLTCSIALLEHSHAPFPSVLIEHKIKLIIYNLGYLPGGDKSLTTQTTTTLESVSEALSLLSAQGMLTITCYPGHPEGAREKQSLLAWAETLTGAKWETFHRTFSFNSRSPSVLAIKKLF